MKITVPISEKLTLTLDEASAYSGIGINRLRQLTNDNGNLVIWVGTKRLIKRKSLDNLIEKEYSI